MLCELQISNFALIEKLTVSFADGLSVLSGETGSGKSIVLQAMQFLLGAKTKTQIIRTGSDEACVEGVFDLSKISRQIFEELPDLARTEELSIGRSLSASGKSKVYINGRLVSLSVLEDIAEKLVNICGQNQHVRLLDQRYHLSLLDGFAETGKEVERYRELFLLWQDSQKKLKELEQKTRWASSRLVELENIVSELEAISIRAGMRAELESKVKKLAAAEQLISCGQSLLDLFSQESGLVARFQSAYSIIQEMQKLDSSFSPLTEGFNAARTEVKEFESEVSRYISKIEVDQDSLEKLRDELAEVARLERKFRCDEEGLIQLLKQSKEELSSLESGVDLQTLREETAHLLEEVKKLAEALSKKRKASALRLGKIVAEELGELNMSGCTLSLSFEEAEVGITGKDRVEILISSNKGEPVKPLRDIASGGELSRIMLVLKKALRDRTGVNVLVFDEVDSGISGQVARAVGKKLLELSLQSQVICITHLPQVASLANHHFLVDKKVKDRTWTEIREINGDDRIEEIARMLAGYKITAASRESARELLSSKN